MSEPRVLVWLLIERAGAVLLVRRKADRPPFAGQWLLPGDAMPAEESASETVERVGREELGVSVTGEEFVETLSLRDGRAEYAVNVFRVGVEGTPRYRESGPYAEARWAPPSELPEALPEGLAALLRLIGSAA